MSEPERLKRIDALLVERGGYERTGRSERAEAVTVELRKLGYTDPPIPRLRKPRRSLQHTADRTPPDLQAG